MSRLPRVLEHLKTGFTAEAASAARFRAYAIQAQSDGHPNLAAAWRELASEKDALAALLLAAAEQVRGGGVDLSAAVAEERYENEALYPRLIRDVDPETAAIFQQIVAAQQRHLVRLESLEDALNAATADLPAELLSSS